jgi:drug/metabolite transporter (DMT)-like permease
LTFEERRTWIEAVVVTGVAGGYFLTLLPQVPKDAVSEIEYQWPLIWSFVVLVVGIVALIVSATVGAIVAATVRRAFAARQRGESASVEVRDADVNSAERRDERDASIDRFGGHVGGIVLAIGVLLPLGLAMAEREPFWVANALYAALLLSMLASSVAKIRAYRRGS